MISASFPVEPHVLKYLSRRFGNVHLVSRNSVLGDLVHRALTNDMVKPVNPTPNHYKYTVAIPNSWFKAGRHSLTYAEQQFLSEFAAKLFKEALFEYTDAKVWEGGKAEPSVKLFMNRFGIVEDDIQLESLYRAYMRHCEKKVDAGLPLKKRSRNRNNKPE